MKRALLMSMLLLAIAAVFAADWPSYSLKGAKFDSALRPVELNGGKTKTFSYNAILIKAPSRGEAENQAEQLGKDIVKAYAKNLAFSPKVKSVTRTNCGSQTVVQIEGEQYAFTITLVGENAIVSLTVAK